MTSYGNAMSIEKSSTFQFILRSRTTTKNVNSLGKRFAFTTLPQLQQQKRYIFIDL